MKKLQAGVDKFQHALYLAKEDKFISEDEFHELVILRDNILIDADSFETESEIITEMVQKLYDEVNNHVLPGMDEEGYDDEEDWSVTYTVLHLSNSLDSIQEISMSFEK